MGGPPSATMGATGNSTEGVITLEWYRIKPRRTKGDSTLCPRQGARARQGLPGDSWRRRGPKRLVCTGICRAISARGYGADGIRPRGRSGDDGDGGDWRVEPRTEADGTRVPVTIGRRPPDGSQADSAFPTGTPGSTCICGEGDEEAGRVWQASFLALDESWKKDAACRGLGPRRRGDPDPFFPEKGQVALANEGRKICFGCPVRRECLEYKEATGSNYGTWGGR